VVLYRESDGVLNALRGVHVDIDGTWFSWTAPKVLKVTAIRNKITVDVNGETVITYIDDEAEYWPSGYFCLVTEANETIFNYVTIRKI
jgi:hypothetical protein